MYSVTQNFIDNSRKFGREFDVKITWGDTVFTSDNIVEIEKEFTGDLFHTVMQEVKATVKGRHVLDSAVINVELGIGYRGSEKEYIDYGEFYVKEHTRIVGEAGSDDTTEFSANDAMLKFHELYDADDFNLTLPITLYDLFVKVANHFGVDVINTSINNGDKLITEDKWANIEEVTYRNILDEIAGASGGVIIIKNGELLLKYIDLDYLFNETIDFSGRPDIATTQSQITWEDLGFKYWYEFGNRTWEQFDANELKHAYEINTIILPNQRYTLIVNDYDEDDTLGLWVNGEFLNFIYNGKIDFISDFEINSLIIKSYNGSSANFKLIGKGVSINEDTMMSLSIKEKLKPINILNITREQQHDNYVLPTNWESIPVDDRSEIVIPDNQIMDKDRATFAQDLLNQIEGISYHPFESESYGTVHFEPFDTVDVIDLDNKVHKSVITSHYMKITSGIKEELSSHEPTFKKEKYALVTDNQRAQMRVYFLVDQQNGVIQGLVNRVDDVEETTSELRVDLEGISGKIEGVSFGSILINPNGEDSDYSFWWSFTTNDELVVFDDLLARDGLTTYTIFEPIEDESVLSNAKISFFANGRQENGLFAVFNEYKYGYRTRRVSGNHSFTLEFREYDSNENYLRKQSFTFNENKNYEELSSIEFGNDTELVGLNYIVSGVSLSNRLELAETMFGIGAPKPYVENVDGVKAWAQSQFQLQKNLIDLKVSQIDFTGDKMISMINIQPSSVKIASKNLDLQGLVTFTNLTDTSTIISGDNIKTGKIKSQYLEFDNAVGTNVNLSGKITTNDLLATSGKIAGFNISGNNLVGSDVSLKPKEITIGQMKLKQGTKYNSEWGTTMQQLVFEAPNGSMAISYATGLSGGQGLPFVETNTLAVEGIRSPIGANYDFFIGSFKSDDIKPSVNNMRDLGTSDARYRRIYLGNQPNVSSDGRIKSAIQNIPHDLVTRLMEIKPKMYLQGTEWHFGYIAQDVERALYLWATKRYGREAKYYVDKFAMLHKSESHLSLLYGELAVLKEQQMMNEITKLNRRLEQLENETK